MDCGPIPATVTKGSPFGEEAWRRMCLRYADRKDLGRGPGIERPAAVVGFVSRRTIAIRRSFKQFIKSRSLPKAPASVFVKKI